MRGEIAENTPTATQAPAGSSAGASPPGPPLAPLRIGMLVMHGIGQQQRWQTLADCVWALMRQWGLRGVFTYLWQRERKLFDRTAASRWRLQSYSHRGFKDLAVVLDLGCDPQSLRPIELTIHEFYWAPMLQSGVGLPGMLAWMARAVLAPLRNLRELRQGLGTFGELLRYIALMLLYLLIAGTLFALLLAMGYCALRLSSVAGETLALWLQRDAAPFARHALQLAVALLALAGWQQAWRALHAERRSAARSAVLWRYYLLLPALAALAGYCGVLLYRCRWWPLLALAVLCALLAAIRAVVVDWLGDVAAYCDASETAPAYKQRRKVQRYAQERLEYLLAMDVAPRETAAWDAPRPDFDAVAVVGHSLGSVIAYDALCAYYARLCELDAQDGAGRGARFKARFRLLFTLGSPLDKVLYFFGDGPAGNPVLGQLRQHERFLAGDGNGMAGPFEQARWVNLWCASDVVSGPLDSYGPGVINTHLESMLRGQCPLINHVQYFENEAAGRLLLDELRNCAG